MWLYWCLLATIISGFIPITLKKYLMMLGIFICILILTKFYKW